jgi:putative nucleotidyltransferase with HDIG domain
MAVMRIGMRATRNIAASFSVFKLFSKEEKSFGFNRIWFWVHSLTTGICAQALATLLKYRHPEDAFLAGLLHDIGKMVLDDFMNEEFEKALRMANSEVLPMWKAEKAIFEVNHSYIGAKIAQAWGFPPVIAEGIGRHHLYESLETETEGFSIAGIVCLADQMAKALGAGSGGDHLAERAAAAIWSRVPKGVPWGKIIEKVVQELKAYSDVLEIPPEQFEMELPEQRKGKAGIFLPSAANYGNLLQIALERDGFETVPFSSLKEQSLKQSGFALVIGDFTLVENGETAIQLQKALSSQVEKAIVLPATDEKSRPNNLDFFWLESQIKAALDIGN